jgi:hypothetical protein
MIIKKLIDAINKPISVIQFLAEVISFIWLVFIVHNIDNLATFCRSKLSVSGSPEGVYSLFKVVKQI